MDTAVYLVSRKEQIRLRTDSDHEPRANSDLDKLKQVERYFAKVEKYNIETKTLETNSGPFRVIFSHEQFGLRKNGELEEGRTNYKTRTIKVYKSSWANPSLAYALIAPFHEAGHAKAAGQNLEELPHLIAVNNSYENLKKLGLENQVTMAQLY